MTKVYDVIISSESTSLRPKALTAVNTIKYVLPTPPIQVQPAFELTPEMAKYAVIAVVFLTILSTLT
jgi:hypothetical protein